MQIDRAVVLVTGATGGIGRALVAEARQRGATVVGADLPGTESDIDLDITDRSAVDRAVAEVVAEHGRLDVVVANAGIGRAGLVEDLSPDDWDRIIDVNIRGTVHTVDAAYRQMLTQDGGAIALVASLSGLVPTPLLVAYSASKAAVVGLGEALRPEAARHGIGVTIACPGPVETPLLDRPSWTAGTEVRRHLVRSAGPALAPARVAAAVLDGVEAGTAVVVPGRASLLWSLQRHSPRLVRRAVARNLRLELDASG
ncbi:MAG TPA: SDR family oxidoreductase [Iamia sp.]